MWFITMATERLRVSQSHDGAAGRICPLNYDDGSFTLMMLADMKQCRCSGITGMVGGA